MADPTTSQQPPDLATLFTSFVQFMNELRKETSELKDEAKQSRIEMTDAVVKMEMLETKVTTLTESLREEVENRRRVAAANTVDLATFTCFPKLARDTQHLMWTCTLSTPKILFLKAVNYELFIDSEDVEIDQLEPVSLQQNIRNVSAEARAIACNGPKYTNHSSSVAMEAQPVFFDQEIDTIFISSVGIGYYDNADFLPWSIGELQIQKLAIRQHHINFILDIEPLYDDVIEFAIKLETLGVQELVLVVQADKSDKKAEKVFRRPATPFLGFASSAFFCDFPAFDVESLASAQNGIDSSWDLLEEKLRGTVNKVIRSFIQESEISTGASYSHFNCY